jgi:alkylhydroperoxidase family enzyme
MSWLLDLPEGADDWERISKVLPEQFGALANLHRGVWSSTTEPVLLELMRLRMAQMLRCDAALALRTPAAVEAGLDEAKAAAVADWPDSPLFSEKERRWLAFTEQWIGDVNGITDELFEPLLEHNTPAECNQIVFSMWPIEQSLRLTALLQLDQSPELHWAAAAEGGQR